MMSISKYLMRSLSKRKWFRYNLWKTAEWIHL